MSEGAISVRLVQAQDYQFDLDFGAGVPALRGRAAPRPAPGSGTS